MRHRLLPSLASAALAAATLACDGRTTGTLVTGATTNVRVRVINGLTSAPAVDLIVDGQVSSAGVGFGNASSYAALGAGSHRLQVRSSTTGTMLVDFTRDLSSAGAFSLIPAAGLADAGALFITDGPSPSTGQGRIRVVHVAAVRGAISVYVTTATADLASATPIVPVLPFGAASQYVSMAAGTYRVRVTPVGDPSTVLLDTGNLVVADGTVRTLLVTDALGGGVPTTLSVLSDAN